MARALTKDAERSNLTRYSTFAAILLLLLLGFMAVQYSQLESKVRTACEQTGSAAKLDLSSFVPICKELSR